MNAAQRHLLAIIAGALEALEALADEHERDLRDAVADLAAETRALDALVRAW